MRKLFNTDLPWISVGVAALCVVLAFLAGCAHGNDPEELRSAVRTYSRAVLSGEGESWDMLSARCRGKVSKNEMNTASGLLSMAFEDEEPSFAVIEDDNGKVLTDNLPDRVMVTYGYNQHALDQSREPWVRESGSWKNDECK